MRIIGSIIIIGVNKYIERITKKISKNPFKKINEKEHIPKIRQNPLKLDRFRVFDINPCQLICKKNNKSSKGNEQFNEYVEKLNNDIKKFKKERNLVKENRNIEFLFDDYFSEEQLSLYFSNKKREDEMVRILKNIVELFLSNLDN